MKAILPALAAILLLTACASPGAPEREAPAHEVVLYTNGVIWTGVEGAPDATTMVVADGVIGYVGAGDNVRIGADRVVDLNGRFVMAGFTDNHVHFLDGGFALASVDLRDAATPEEFSRRIVAYTNELPAGRWVLNGNWDHELWGGTLPERSWIDAGTGDTPVFVSRLDGHMALANSAALARAGITAATPSPEGGEIVHDAQGQPTGVLKDNAMNLMFAVIPAPSEAELLQAFGLAQQHALRLGLTQVHDVGALDSVRARAVFRTAHARGLQRIRIYSMTPILEWRAAKTLVDAEGSGDEMLRWGGLKGFADGSLGSSTAWFYAPFSDNADKSGFPVTDPAQLRSAIAEADAAGLHLAVHAIGDKAIDTVIDDFRAAAGDNIRARRFRIEHFQHPTREAIAALAENGIVASMQPYHAIDDGRWAEKRIGAQRIQTTYAFRSILDAGGILTFGSDWPVAPLSPLEGVYAAVTRRTIDGANPDGWVPEQKISVEEALTAYTRSNAYAGFDEARGGTLESGKRADFVVLSADPRAIDPVAIRDIEVLATVIGGAPAYTAEGWEN